MESNAHTREDCIAKIPNTQGNILDIQKDVWSIENRNDEEFARECLSDKRLYKMEVNLTTSEGRSDYIYEGQGGSDPFP